MYQIKMFVLYFMLSLVMMNIRLFKEHSSFALIMYIRVGPNLSTPVNTNLDIKKLRLNIKTGRLKRSQFSIQLFVY